MATNLSESTSFEPGDRVVQEEPWMHTITAAEVERRCYSCLKWLTYLDRAAGIPVPLLTNNRCSGCKFARYCSTICQNSDWKERHKLECAALGRIVGKNFTPPDHFLIMLKIVAKLVHPRTDKTAFLGPRPNERTFADLKSHLAEIRQNQELMEYLFWMRTMVGMYLGLNADHMDKISPVEFLEIYGKIKCNTFLIEGSNWEQIGIGIYLRGSAFDHSCTPSACQTFVGKQLTITATQKIDDIKNVRISYVDPFEPRRIRQEKLRQMYHFTCTCPLCSSPAQDAEKFALRCTNLKCSAEIPSDQRANSPCQKCGRSNLIDRQAEFDQYYEQMTGITRTWINKVTYTQSDKTDLVEVESKLEKLLHPRNPLWPAFYIKKGFFLQGCGDKSWPQSFARALELYRPWLSPIDPRIGWLAYYAANPQSSDYLDTMKKMDECRRVMGLTFGPEHEMVEEAERICRQYELKLRNSIGGRR